MGIAICHLQSDNLDASTAKLAEISFSSCLLCWISFELLEDQPCDQVGSAASLMTKMQGAHGHWLGKRMAGEGAPLGFGHQGGSASSRLDHRVDLQAS